MTKIQDLYSVTKDKNALEENFIIDDYMDAQTADGQQLKLTDIESTEAFLKANKIEFCTLRHEITPTNEIMKEIVKFTDESFKGTVLAK